MVHTQLDVTKRDSVARVIARLAAAIALTGAIGCAATGTGRQIPVGTAQPDQFLFERGTQALAGGKWLTAREYFKQLNETYVQSPLRPDAKLGIGDSYIGEGGAEALVLAINEFREFISFYPLHRRVDYAQFKLADAHFMQMRGPTRDQTETRGAIREFEVFITRYPNSSYLAEVRERLRASKDRLGDYEFGVGRFYYRSAEYYPAAIERFNALLKQDPEYTGRDAVYFFLGESLTKIKREAEALPYYERIIKEFGASQYLPDAQKRVRTLKAQLEARIQ